MDIFAEARSAGERRFQVSESARKRLVTLLAAEAPGTMLRVTVSGGGCSGFQYGFGFDATRNEDDRLFTYDEDGVTVIVDEVSLDYLDGSELDFVEDLAGASFQVRNPNATSSCGCGSSFSM